MGLSIILTAQNDEDWIELVLNQVLPFAERVVVIDRGSRDQTRVLVEKTLATWAGESSLLTVGPEQSIAAARAPGLRQILATHSGPALLMQGCWYFPEKVMSWCSRLLEEVTLYDSSLGLPPRQHDKRRDPEVTDGVVVRHLALPAIRPTTPESAMGQVLPPEVCFITLAGLVMDEDGTLREPTGEALAASPYRLNLPTTPRWDYSAPLPVAGEPLPDWARDRARVKR